MENRNSINEIQKQVGMFFDHELDSQREQELLQRVKSDPNYQEVFSKEQNIRENLRKHVRRPGVSPDLIQSIKDNIRVV